MVPSPCLSNVIFNNKKTRLEETLHHATGDEGLSPRLIAGQMVEEGEEGGGKRLREVAAVAAAVGGCSCEP